MLSRSKRERGGSFRILTGAFRINSLSMRLEVDYAKVTTLISSLERMAAAGD